MPFPPRFIIPSFVTVVVAVAGCANPVNRVTSDNYADTCVVAERAGKLDVAEQACYRALINVDWGHLGPELKSQRLYNLARIKRQLAKFPEAEDLLRQSLAIENGLTGPGSIQSGRRLVELSVNLAAQDRWSEGADYLAAAFPVATQFSAQERSYLKLVLRNFGTALTKDGRSEQAAAFESKAASL